MTDVRSLIESGLEHHHAGRLDAAAGCYREALAADKGNAEAHHLLGIIALQSGNPEEAIERFEAAVQREPGNAKFSGNLGAALLAAGDPSRALDVLERAAEQDPGSVDVLCNLAAALRGLGKVEDALALYRRAYEQAPGDAAILCGLAAAFLDLCQFEAALDAAGRAIALDKSNGEWRNMRGAVLLSMKRYEDALVELEQAVRLAPHLADAQSNLALAFQSLHRLDDSARVYRDMVARWPDIASAQAGLGRTLRLQGQPSAAVACYRRALDLDPGNARIHSSLLFNLLGDPDLDEAGLFQAHRAWQDRHAALLDPGPIDYDNLADPDRRLRIGYVSSDFRAHPVGRLIYPVLACHDRSSVEIVAYSQTTDGDDLTRRVETAVDVFRPVATLDDEGVATLIRDDRIDILVDLSGHSARNRLTVFARRPAPVQTTWLGYMSSTGLVAIDYLIGDPVHTPQADDACYTETIRRLPHDLLCFDPPDDAPAVVPPPSQSKGHITFGCFNNPGKISPAVLERWARILQAVPDGRLYLRYLGYDDQGAQRQILGRLGALGVDSGRIRFAGRAVYKDVLASYGEIDIALDTFPYSGTMTTLEALWMGVPVVAFTGDRMVARQAAAHLTAAGLGDLVADDADGYVERAISLAGASHQLVDLRTRMRDRLRASPLCDVEGFTRSLEALYRQMWRDRCAAL